MLNIKYEKGRYYINQNDEKPYVIDINNKIIIGKVGRQIKTLPIAAYNFRDFVNNDSPQISTLAQIKYYYDDIDMNTTFNILLNVDKLTNAGINICCVINHLSDIDVKNFIKYCKNNNFDRIYTTIVLDYKRQLKINQFNNNFPQFRAYEKAYETYSRLNIQYQKYFDIYGYYMFVRGYDCLGIVNVLKQYIDDCIDLDIQPQKEKNFLQLAKDTHNTKMLLGEKISERKFNKNYKLHEKAFNFKTDKFSIVIPKSGSDLIIEGQKMHHCVGSYVDSVENNKCYIVFVRKNEDLSEPYITAQIYDDGIIGQYYLSYDRPVIKEEDIDFRTQFQDWLQKTW